MRNKIIESTIEQVIDETDNSAEFKACFKKYVKNVFDNNAMEGDLKRALSLISVEEGE